MPTITRGSGPGGDSGSGEGQEGLTLTTTRPTQAPSRPPTNTLFDLQPPQAARRSRLPEVALGLLLVVGGALAALVWQISANRTTSVLALRKDVAQGQVIQSSDLELVQIRSNERLRFLVASQANQVQNQVARIDLKAGTLLTPEAVRQGQALQPGQAVVGIAVKSGDVPSLKLSPGDRLTVVLTPSATEADTAFRGGAVATPDQVLVKEAVVLEVARPDSQNNWHLSLVMTQAEATATARAAAVNRVRLVEVPQGS